MSFLREETKKRGFSTVDGVHMGPCEIHTVHAHTIGPDGSLFACSRLRRRSAAVHRTHRRPPGGRTARRRCAPSKRLAAWEMCNDCAFIPVCAGGCTVAAHNELGDMHAPELPQAEFRSWAPSRSRHEAVRQHVNALTVKERQMNRQKKTQNPNKNGTLRPWLVDVVVDNLSPTGAAHHENHRHQEDERQGQDDAGLPVAGRRAAGCKELVRAIPRRHSFHRRSSR